MKNILIAATIFMMLITGVTLVMGQNTGGDKRQVTSGLNPQPLPPGRHRQYRRTNHHKHKHRYSTAYSPQWGGKRHTSGSCSSCSNKPK